MDKELGYRMLVKKLTTQPKDTSKGHFYVSLVKSVFRIITAILLIYVGWQYSFFWLQVAGGTLLVAELLGIVEELV